MTKQEHWAAVIFLSECILFHIDNLEKTPHYQQKLKHHLKGAVQEIEKIQEASWKSFKETAKKENMPLMEMNYAVSNAHYALIDLFKNSPSWQIPYMVKVIKDCQEQDLFKTMTLNVEKIKQ